MKQGHSISVSQLSHAYESPQGDVVALGDINLDIAPGEFVSIVGQSGSGKSTLLKAIGGLLSPSSGSVLVDGVSPEVAQTRKSIGFVFQDGGLLPWLNVIENIRLPLKMNAGNDKVERDDPEDVLSSVGLSGFERYYPHQLSGGMKQRVALARSLVLRPSLLLMDEPLGSLDELTRESMRYEILRLWEQIRSTVVFVTHSINEAVLLSDRVIVISSRPGRIVQDTRVNLPRPRPEGIEDTEDFLRNTRIIRDNMALVR